MLPSTRKLRPSFDRIISGIREPFGFPRFAMPRISFEKLAFLTTLQPNWRSFDGWFTDTVAGIPSRQHLAS
jgi:hypothetical protein